MRAAILVAVVACGLVAAAAVGDGPPEPRVVLKAPKGYAFSDVAISSDGKFAALEMGLGIGVGDLKRGVLVRSMDPPSASALEVEHLAFAGSDGEWLVSSHEHDFVRVWSVSTGGRKSKLAPTWKEGDSSSTFGARIFAASPSRREAALAYWDGALEFVDLTNPSRRQKVSFGDDRCPWAVAYSFDGNRLALVLGSHDDATQVNVYARDADKGTWSLAASFQDEPPDGADGLAKRPVQVWRHVAVDSDGTRVFAAGAHVEGDAELPKPWVLRAWDATTGTRLWNFEGNDDHRSVLLAPNGNGLFVGTLKSAVFLDPLTGELRRKLAPHPDSHDAFAMDGTGTTVFAVTSHTSGGKLVAWDVPLASQAPR